VSDYAKRIRSAQRMASENGIDAYVITPGANLEYLTGYHALPLERLTCLVLPAKSAPTLVVPRLERPAAEASPAHRLQIADWTETENPFSLVRSLLPRADVVAVDDHMWASRVMALQHAMPHIEQGLAGALLTELRIRKTDAEVHELRQAAEAIDRVHARMGEWLRAGRTEREVGKDIAEAILAEGHTSVDFVIVASGPNGASAHHELSDRVIEVGDPVVVDIGGSTATGYCSDETRTYAVGEPAAEFRTAYDVLQRAQAAATAAVRPGTTAASIDAAAREVITEAGYGELFVHRTGHGIGLETHEEPYIVDGNDRLLEPGMAFSIEPGIYVEGRHGARIEDIVVCTEHGVESLNQRPRDLMVLPA
jgi:Xaa-Pro aminopeptidase